MISGDIGLLVDLINEGVYDPAQIDPRILPRVLALLALRARRKEAAAALRVAERAAEDEQRAAKQVRIKERDANAWRDLG